MASILQFSMKLFLNNFIIQFLENEKLINSR